MARPPEQTVRVKDYRLFMIALKDADKKMARAAREEIRKAGDAVKDDAASRMGRYDARSAAGYKTRVRQRGVAVEQTLRRTTGKRPNFGVLNMTRALEPALDANEQNTIEALDRAFDRICHRFNSGATIV